MSEAPRKKPRLALPEVSASQFYGVKQEQVEKPVIDNGGIPTSEELEQRRIRMNNQKRQDENGIKRMSKLFYKQREAFSYLEAVKENTKQGKYLTFDNAKHREHMVELCDEQLFVLSCQWNPTLRKEEYGPEIWSNFAQIFPEQNKRKEQERYFMVVGIDWFWNNYSKLPTNIRHFYEIIREDDECFLYFDIEADLTKNPHYKEDKRIVTVLVEQLRSFITEKKPFGEKQVQLVDQDVLDLDSSTATKFSKHLIIRLRTRSVCAFKNNWNHMAKFVSRFVKRLRQLRSTIPEVDELLFVANVHLDEIEEQVTRDTCIIDEGVYTRNRAFRCFLSKKYNPNLMEAYKCASLAIAKENQFPVTDEKDCFMKSLVTNVPKDTEFLTVEDDGSDNSTTMHRSPTAKYTNSTQGYAPLEQSEIDKLSEFISSVIQGGYVRSYQYDNYKQTVTFYIGGNRYCENIGREHKSNHVMYIVDLARGNGIYYQTCLDPDCRGENFSSAERKIPSEYLPNMNRIMERQVSLLDEFDFDDKQIDSLYEQFEKS